MCEVWETGRCKAESQADSGLCLEAQQDELDVAHAEAVWFIVVDALEAGNTAVLKVSYKENRH